MSQSALMIIDLQNEFLHKSGMFGKKHIDPNTIIPTVERLLRFSENAKIFSQVIWIRSEYNHRKRVSPKRPIVKNCTAFEFVENSDLLASAHFGMRACCEAGTWQAEFIASIIPMIKADHMVLTKNRYSAFTCTDLLGRLEKLSITRLYICGVTSNFCIQANCCDATACGYEVILIEDATAATNQKLHDQAVKFIANHYAKVMHSSEICGEQ